MAVLPGLVIPPQTLHQAEALERATAAIHRAAREAVEAQSRLEAALKPYTVTQVGECRDVRRLGRELAGLLGYTDAIAHDGRDIARQLAKGSA